jgi:DNA-binding GntR family transcriptional regulator
MKARNVKAADLAIETIHAGDHPSLSAMIYASLHTSILNGTLIPGQVLRQEELAARFKTSRVPLREALQSLQAEGLVVLRPRRGYAVASLDGEQLIGLLQLRILIEGYAGYVGTQRRTLTDVKAVGIVLQDMDKLPLKLARESHRLRWSSLNRKFHAGIFAPSGNEHLLQISANLNAKLDPYIMSDTAIRPRLEASREDHRRIFEAFSSGDADTVGRLSRLHCERVAKSFTDILFEQGDVQEKRDGQLTDLGPAMAMVMQPRALPEPRAALGRRAAKG